jgi:hypothetical protein
MGIVIPSITARVMDARRMRKRLVCRNVDQAMMRNVRRMSLS